MVMWPRDLRRLRFGFGFGCQTHSRGNAAGGDHQQIPSRSLSHTILPLDFTARYHIDVIFPRRVGFVLFLTTSRASYRFPPRSHFACTRSDTLFDVPPSGGRLNTVTFTVRSP